MVSKLKNFVVSRWKGRTMQHFIQAEVFFEVFSCVSFLVKKLVRVDNLLNTSENWLL